MWPHKIATNKILKTNDNTINCTIELLTLGSAPRCKMMMDDTIEGACGKLLPGRYPLCSAEKMQDGSWGNRT